MLRRTEGIVLRTFPFGEADLIVTFLTSDFGLTRAFAKSPRKIGSRFGSSLEPLTCVRLSIWGKEEAALPKLTQADIVRSFQTIRDNFMVFLEVSDIVELTLNLLPEREANGKIYALLSNTLGALELLLSRKNSRPNSARKANGGADRGEGMPDAVAVLMNQYRAKVLFFAGFAPKLDACGRCGEQGSRFFVSEGTVLCEVCAESADSPLAVSGALIALYRDLLTWDTSMVQRIKPSKVLNRELSELLRLHVRTILAKPLNAEAFLCAASGKISLSLKNNERIMSEEL